MSLRSNWLPPLTLMCIGAGLVGALAGLFAPGRQIVRAEAAAGPSRRIVVHAAWPAKSLSMSQAPSNDPAGRRYRGGMIMSGSTRSGAVLFTFDDGPDLKNTPHLLDALDARGTKAIFFIVGERIFGKSRRAAKRRELVREIGSRGHLIGNHTFSHRQLTLLSDADVRDEILRTERLLTSLMGQRPWLFRPPGGARSERVDKIVAELGYTTVLWNMDTGDTAARTAEQVFGNWKQVIRTPAARGGGIVLLHDLHPESVESFGKIYDHIQTVNPQRRAQDLVDWRVASDLDAFYVPRADADASDVAPSLSKR